MNYQLIFLISFFNNTGQKTLFFGPLSFYLINRDHAYYSKELSRDLKDLISE